jgi:hypothetical protein
MYFFKVRMELESAKKITALPRTQRIWPNRRLKMSTVLFTTLVYLTRLLPKDVPTAGDKLSKGKLFDQPRRQGARELAENIWRVSPN